MHYLHTVRAAFLTGAALLLAVPATLSADIMITQANDPSFENVLFNAPGLILGPAPTVQGETQSGVRVDFISGGGNLVVQGQGVQDENGDPFNNLTVQAQMGEVFTRLIFNLNVTADGTVTFNTAPGSIPVGDPDTFDVAGGGQNFFTLEATGGQSLASVTLNLGGGALLQNINQVRTGAATVVPEPSTFLLLGGGLILAAARKRIWS
jgi:hypothetical protein